MQRLLTLPVVALFLLGVFATTPAWADVVWDESVDGDLSSTSVAGTIVGLPFSDNQIIGTVGAAAVPSDFEDFITFTINPGETLDAVILNAFDPDFLGTSGNTSTLFEVDGGTSWESPNTFGDTTMTTALVGTNILPTTTLGPGTYTIRLGEGSGPASYEFSFLVSAIPEPSTVGLLGMLLVGGVIARRKRVV